MSKLNINIILRTTNSVVNISFIIIVVMTGCSDEYICAWTIFMLNNRLYKQKSQSVEGGCISLIG